MTRASGDRALTASALATANRLAMPGGSAPDPSRPPLTAASSTSAGSTAKETPAASSMRRRNGLVDARTSRGRLGSTILQLPRILRGGRLLAVVQQPDDGRCRLLDGSARHIDHRPAMLRAKTA